MFCIQIQVLHVSNWHHCFVGPHSHLLRSQSRTLMSPARTWCCSSCVLTLMVALIRKYCWRKILTDHWWKNLLINKCTVLFAKISKFFRIREMLWICTKTLIKCLVCRINAGNWIQCCLTWCSVSETFTISGRLWPFGRRRTFLCVSAPGVLVCDSVRSSSLSTAIGTSVSLHLCWLVAPLVLWSWLSCSVLFDI